MSDIAKLTGLHPFADLPSLMNELLYQGCPELRISDSQDLGIVWVSEERAIQDLLEKADTGTRAAFTAAQSARPSNNLEAASVRSNVKCFQMRIFPCLGFLSS